MEKEWLRPAEVMERLNTDELNLASLVFDERLAVYDATNLMSCKICQQNGITALKSMKGLLKPPVPTYYREQPDPYTYFDVGEVARAFGKYHFFVFKSSEIEAFAKEHCFEEKHKKSELETIQITHPMHTNDTEEALQTDNFMKTDLQKSATQEAPLNGYKEIANFFGVCVDTVRKNYKKNGCPIKTCRTGRVYAYPTELNQWRDNGSKRNRRKK